MQSERIAVLPGGEQRRRSARAFTLIELVAVIAVVAVLALLVLPALAKSKDDGTRAVCTNNLRQMGLASNMYASDNSDYLAFANWDGGSAVGPGWLYWAVGNIIPDPTAPAYTNDPASAWQSGLWFPYVKNYHSYLCPVDIRSPTYTAPYATANSRNNKLCSYVMDGAVAGYPDPDIDRTCKTSDAWAPQCYLLWEPNENNFGLANPGSFDYNDGANFPSEEAVGGLHILNGGELVTVAGNVQFVTKQQFQFQSNYQGTTQQPKSLAWWSPFSSSGH